MIIILNQCPKCGCNDIRKEWGIAECFKCGYSEKIKTTEKSWSIKSKLKSPTADKKKDE